MHVLLADDQPEVCSALRLLLEQESEHWRIIGDAPDAISLLNQMEKQSPDVVLLDWELAGLGSDSGQNGARTIAAMRRLLPNLNIIVLSGRAESKAEALAAGADAFVSKYDPADCLLAALWGAAQNHARSCH